MVKRKQKKGLIAFYDNIITIEPNLPLPKVYYPGFYGAFFAFSEELDNTEKYFCSCAKTAIKNYIELRKKYGLSKSPESNNRFVISKYHFPESVVDDLYNRDINSTSQILKGLRFKDNICHECNLQTPTYKYCHPMYGGSFVRSYGWYINKQFFEYGVRPVSCNILEKVCPKEVFTFTDISKEEFIRNYNHLSASDLSLQNDPLLSQSKRKIKKYIENRVREKFGFKKVGESWTSETLLYKIVSEILPEYKIHRHYRPDFLDFLELDIYIPKLQIGIEYQGIQHFKPIFSCFCWYHNSVF